MALIGGPAHAGSSLDLNALQNLNQGDFIELTRDLGAALSYKPMTPSTTLGITGFDIGAAVTATSLRYTQDIKAATQSGSIYSTLPIPTLRIEKGLPLDLDVGLMYGKAPRSDVALAGGNLRWAILPGDIAIPTVAVRVAATQLTGVSQLKLTTQSADISIAKGFLIATPYGGVGVVRTAATPQGIAALTAVTTVRSKVFAGVDVNLGLVNLDFEGDTTGGVSSYGIKVGFRF